MDKTPLCDEIKKIFGDVELSIAALKEKRSRFEEDVDEDDLETASELMDSAIKLGNQYRAKVWELKVTLTKHPTKLFPCTEIGCESRYTQKGAVGTHVKVVHKGLKRFKCSFEGCDKIFGYRNVLDDHMTSHVDERPFTCTICGFGSKTQGHHRDHMLTHSEDRPHECPEEGCGKTFKTKCSVREHQKCHQKLEKRFECSMKDCEMRFVTKDACKRHEKRHSGERPFPCTFKGCEKRFFSMPEVRSHLVSHTGEKVFHCSVCGKGMANVTLGRRHEQKCKAKSEEAEVDIGPNLPWDHIMSITKRLFQKD